MVCPHPSLKLRSSTGGCGSASCTTQNVVYPLRRAATSRGALESHADQPWCGSRGRFPGGSRGRFPAVLVVLWDHPGAVVGWGGGPTLVRFSGGGGSLVG